VYLVSRPLTDSLTDTDDIAQPLFRFLANYIATKTSSLSETDINRLFNAGISDFVDGILEPFVPFFKMFFAGSYSFFLSSSILLIYSDSFIEYLFLFLGCFGIILLKNVIIIYQVLGWNNFPFNSIPLPLITSIIMDWIIILIS